MRPNILASMAFVGIASLAASGCKAADGPLKITPDGRRLVLTFADEFNSFDRWTGGKGVWRTTFRDGRAEDDYELRTLKWNKELQLYVDPEMRAHAARSGTGRSDELARPLGLNPFQIHNGNLAIIADRASSALAAKIDRFQYTSGLITTQPSFSQTYGYFEIRAKLPRGKGVWPAFWLLPSDLGWPPEIDVLESIGDPSKVYVTAHSKLAKDGGTEVAVSPEGFHTYSVSWDRQELVWFVDGREVKRIPTPADLNKPMYLLANVALGGDWAGAPDAATPFPARFVIDYIRAYRFAR